MVETPPPPITLRERLQPIRERFALLDGVRLVAALLVVAFHFTARKTDAWTVPVSERAHAIFDATKYGVFGVGLFFVLSGFAILTTAWNRPLRDFVASRAVRA